MDQQLNLAELAHQDAARDAAEARANLRTAERNCKNAEARAELARLKWLDADAAAKRPEEDATTRMPRPSDAD